MFTPFVSGMSFYDILIYFVLFAIAGYICEVAFAAIVLGKFVNRGFLSGPWCPIYGFGVVIVAICLKPISGSLLVLFVGSVILTSVLEYFTGYVLEKVFDQKWWDYTDEKFNIGGYVCLKFSLLWGVACVAVVKLVLPAVDALIRFTPRVIGMIVTGVAIAVMLIDLASTVIAIMGIKKKLRLIDLTVSKLKAGTEDMGSFISKETLAAKEKYDELAKTASEKKAELEKTFDEKKDEFEIKRGEFAKTVSEKKDEFVSAVSEKKGEFAKTVSEKKGEFVSAVSGKRDELAKNASEKYAAFAALFSEKRGEKRLMNAFPTLKKEKVDGSLGKLREQLKLISEKSGERAAKRRQTAFEEYSGTVREGDVKPFASGLCFTKLFWIFMIGNVVGFLLETFWAFFVQRRIELRVGLVWGPFIPVYGFGAIVMTLLLYRLYKKRDIVIFAAAGIIGGAFEYFCSLFQEKAFGTISWEYSGTTANIGGRTNLMYALIWGVLGLLWVKDIYPFLSKKIEKIPKKVGSPLTVILCVFMLADMFVSGTAVIRRGERMRGIPAENAYESWLDLNLDDKYLDLVYPNMIYVTEDGEKENAAENQTDGDETVPENQPVGAQ